MVFKGSGQVVEPEGLSPYTVLYVAYCGHQLLTNKCFYR
jgi:hypothetical protein